MAGDQARIRSLATSSFNAIKDQGILSRPTYYGIPEIQIRIIKEVSTILSLLELPAVFVLVTKKSFAKPGEETYIWLIRLADNSSEDDTALE